MFELWRAKRKLKKLDEEYRPRLNDAKKKREDDKVGEIITEWSLESNLIEDEIDSILTTKLLRRAQKEDLPFPARPMSDYPNRTTAEQQQFWSQNAVTGAWYLSSEGRTTLRQRIRRETTGRHASWARWVTLVIGLIGTATGLVAVLQWKIMTQQLQVMEDSNTLTRQGMEIDQRAWVGMKSITLGDVVKPNRKPRALVVIQNVGNTPSLGTYARARMLIGDSPFPSDPAYPDPTPIGSRTTLFPGIEFKIPIESRERLTGRDIASLNNMRSFLYIYGVVEYVDIFGNSRETTFCGVYTPGKLGLTACPVHNDAQ